MNCFFWSPMKCRKQNACHVTAFLVKKFIAFCHGQLYFYTFENNIRDPKSNVDESNKNMDNWT